jgi:hypothetical protein
MLGWVSVCKASQLQARPQTLQQPASTWPQLGNKQPGEESSVLYTTRVTRVDGNCSHHSRYSPVGSSLSVCAQPGSNTTGPTPALDAYYRNGKRACAPFPSQIRGAPPKGLFLGNNELTGNSTSVHTERPHHVYVAYA